MRTPLSQEREKTEVMREPPYMSPDGPKLSGICESFSLTCTHLSLLWLINFVSP